MYQITIYKDGNILHTGLHHSDVRDAIMYPWYNPYDPQRGIHLKYDDISGIQSLYGQNFDNTINLCIIESAVYVYQNI